MLEPQHIAAQGHDIERLEDEIEPLHHAANIPNTRSTLTGHILHTHCKGAEVAAVVTNVVCCILDSGTPYFCGASPLTCDFHIWSVHVYFKDLGDVLVYLKDKGVDVNG